MSFDPPASYYEEDSQDPDYMKVEDHEEALHDLRETIADLYATMMMARKNGHHVLELECIQDLNKLLGVKI
jgi:hypothetical protein